MTKLEEAVEIMQNIDKHVISMFSVLEGNFPNVVDNDGKIMSKEELLFFLSKETKEDMDEFERGNYIEDIPDENMKAKIQSWFDNLKLHMTERDGKPFLVLE